VAAAGLTHPRPAVGDGALGDLDLELALGVHQTLAQRKEFLLQTRGLLGMECRNGGGDLRFAIAVGMGEGKFHCIGYLELGFGLFDTSEEP